ncbi:acetylornithine deacetylase/succinyl-diaminopimelate desuccinylase-like protein [Kribbella sp. VKM Ac-2527]|uniref:Acetylornithine deacetylase/succinyl-diaminopimelate desuccinylase-like protein n=1 Tax=Kribbella caucasensis TaxID=2512215 RepID=A0A4R6KD08_9ACTN|nr:M20/M25/M40 family metallo-hydrolase [Kribbella sp. VKM Ac-2527]TDO48043.1 acetylornithine deacetylase/succinyl-diaminopimelate desuccinylase-like protein [Kribbella sp. VKM Ac-2527]
MTTEQAVGRVMEYVTRDRLATAICGVVDIPSPTGAEARVAEWIVDHLIANGVTARLQPLDDRQANAVGTLAGGDGPSTLLYAPLDTFTTGDPAYDVPSATLAMRPDMLPRATLHGDLVQGLGAGNPKGHAACVIVAMEALAADGIELPGDVIGGFGAGGMPSFAIEGGRQNTGHGVGAGFLLERGFTTDYGVIAKPGWNVSHEEVGLVWLDVLVPGIHTYAGSRHRLPYRNAVALAGEVAGHLEDWLEEYAVRHEHGTMRPQGIVSSINGGSERLAASSPALVRLRLDLRITTAQTPAGVTREVRAEVERLGAKLGAELRVEQVAAVPASHTSPGEPIVRAAVAAWEAVAGERHVPILANSGATDANILRMRGVPTARVGMPKVPATPTGEPPDFTAGMNLADLREMRRLVEILVRTVLLVEGL